MHSCTSAPSCTHLTTSIRLNKHRPHCKEIWIYVFSEKESRGLSSYFHIHVSLSYLHSMYIPTFGHLFSCSRIGRPIRGIYKSLTETWLSIGVRTVAAQFLSWEYLFRIFGIVSLQCSITVSWVTLRRLVFAFCSLSFGGGGGGGGGVYCFFFKFFFVNFNFFRTTL